MSRRHGVALIIKDLHINLWSHDVITQAFALSGNHTPFSTAVRVEHTCLKLFLDSTPEMRKHLVPPANNTDETNVTDVMLLCGPSEDIKRGSIAHEMFYIARLSNLFQFLKDI